MGRLHRNKHLVLVLTMVCAYIVSSASHGTPIARIVSNSIVSVIAFVVLAVVFEHQRHRVIAFVFAIAGVLSAWAHYALPADRFEVSLSVLHYALLATFLGYSVAVILGNIFRKGTVSTDDVMGAVGGYLIAGAAWSSLYALVQTLEPDAFALPAAFANQALDWSGRTAVFNYFSIVTLTTVGYGDITPLHAPAPALVMLEAVFGQFYIAVVVAQLVGARLSNPVPQQNGDSQLHLVEPSIRGGKTK
ncbi:MAG TPA: ion channel [Burkholderiaceae bacterium]|nr:ion channel [Burkholderiaceae bacterium]